ncbi:hypothetical protein, partial [uncultured Alcanivorax sp.]|uniref:hypothetical protein n=1 Tax=uncultured Alcanivorax sp. TaxID=191215 RepID=UPI00260EC84A
VGNVRWRKVCFCRPAHSVDHVAGITAKTENGRNNETKMLSGNNKKAPKTIAKWTWESSS